MSKNILFAIDSKTEEIIVSDSPKWSNKINFIERIRRQENILLYNAVITLTSMTNDSNFNISGLVASMPNSLTIFLALPRKS